MNDFIFYDTGEGRLVELTLERLLSLDFDDRPSPLVPNRSYLARSALTAALMSIATVALLTLKTRSTDIRLAAVVAGTGLACFASILIAREALRQIMRRPQELQGKGIVLATVFLSMCGMAASAIALYFRFGKTIAQAIRRRLE
jgi:hypothetical protein